MRSDDHESSYVERLLAGAAKKSLLATMPDLERQMLAEAQGPDTKRAQDALWCLLEYYELDAVNFLGKKLPRSEVLDTWLDIILRVARRLRRPPLLSMEQEKPFISYLYRVAHNAAIDALTKTSNHQITSLDQLLEQWPDDLPDSSSLSGLLDLVDSAVDLDIDSICYDILPADMHDGLKDHPLISARISKGEAPKRIAKGANASSHEGLTPIIRAISKLPPKHRACLILHDWFDLDFALVGELVGAPAATACFKAWISRKRVRADLAYIWWVEDGSSQQQIAEDLRLEEKDVPSYIEEGRRLYASAQTPQKRGGRNER